MYRNILKKHKKMILASIFFFYLGYGITLNFLRIDCADAVSRSKSNHVTPVDQVEYVVLVLSSPSNEEKRDAIRATWANFAGNIFIENGVKLYKWNHTWTDDIKKQHVIKVYFAIGTNGLSLTKLEKLQIENQRSNDLLLLEFTDNYKSLAKKVLLSMKWINESIQGLKYVIKCDDDSFVRVDLIVRDLEAYAPEMKAEILAEYVTFKNNISPYKGLYWGYFDGRAKAFSRGKWQETSWFLCDNYLPYALGGGYVISQNIVEFLAQNTEHFSCYNSEDVSMGVWTAALDGINRVHDVRFDTEWKSRGCSANMLVRHKQSTSDMFQMYRTLVHTRGEKLCKTEVIERPHYAYNWQALPSKCCR